MPTLPLLTLALLATSAAPIDFAVVERTGLQTARLTVLKADPRLQAICLDLVGFGGAEVEAAKAEAQRRPVWLYMGPRRIGRGRVSGFDSAASPVAPCAVTAQAEFDEPIPIAAQSDLLWATSHDLGSAPHGPLAQGAVERARLALPDPLSQACLQPLSATSRAAQFSTFVNLVCSVGASEFSSLLVVPRSGAPQVLLFDKGDEGRLLLLDVLDPTRKSAHALVLARQMSGGRRVELWQVDASQTKRVDYLAY